MAKEKMRYFVEHVQDDYHRRDGKWSIIQLREFSKPDADRKVQLMREIDLQLRDYHTQADTEALHKLNVEHEGLNGRGRTVITFANKKRVSDYARKKGIVTSTSVLPRDTILEEIPPFFRSKPGTLTADALGFLARARDYTAELLEKALKRLK